MKAFLPVCLVTGLCVAPLSRAQVVPSTPTKFDTRRIGDALSGGSTFRPSPPTNQTVVRTVTHIVLGEPRQWKTADGKTFVGKLIAFEDIVTQGNQAAPEVPKNPTIVRDGKARVLVNSKTYEIALEKLGTAERQWIEETRLAVAAKK